MKKRVERKPPVAVNDKLRLAITGLSHDGEGVGAVDGFTVFVPVTAPGDLAEVQVVSVRKNYARALPLSIVEHAQYRTAASCELYPQCGGCRLQHIEYNEQLRWKQSVVREALRRIGGQDVPVLPVLGMEEPWRYRNKAQVPVAKEDGRVAAGFFEKGSHRVVDLDECDIQHPACNKAVDAARSALQQLQIPVYDETSGLGAVRHILVRVSFASGKVLLTLVTAGRELPQAGRLVEMLLKRIENLAGIVQNVNPNPGNVILGRDNITLWGQPWLVEELGDLCFRISPHSFFQVNTLQAEVLYAKVLEYAGLTGKETVFDLYCGTGSIALYLSRKAARVVGVEELGAAVEDARFNADANGIDNAEFFAGRAEDLVPELLGKGYRADVVVLDPPRKGCAPSLLETVVRAKPERIVYVSCNPATLARDLKLLAEKGCRTAEVQPVDMFPHTSHVETVVLITRVDK